MTSKTSSVFIGTLVRAGQPLVGARIEARDADERIQELLGHAYSDDEGAFAIHVEQALIDRWFGPAEDPELSLRVIELTDPPRLRADSKTNGLRWRPRRQLWRQAQVVLDLNEAARVDNFVVQGRVLDATGEAVPDAAVTVLDTDIDGTERQAEARTDRAGYFRAVYPAPPYASGKSLADLTLRVSDRSFVFVQAAPLLDVELSLAQTPARGRSQAQRLIKRVRAVIGRLHLADLDDDQLERLALSIREPVESVRALRQAEASVRRGDTQLDSELIFGLLQTGAIDRADDTLVRPVGEQMQGLERAAADGLIRPLDDTDRVLVEEAIVEAQIDAAFRPDDPGGLAVGELVRRCLAESPEKGETPRARFPRSSRVLAELFRHDGPTESLWSRSSVAEIFSAREIVGLRRIFTWSAITHGHGPLMAHLQKRAEAGEPEDRFDLAKRDADDWVEIIDGIDEGEKTPEAIRRTRGRGASPRLRRRPGDSPRTARTDRGHLWSASQARCHRRSRPLSRRASRLCLQPPPGRPIHRRPAAGSDFGGHRRRSEAHRTPL